MHLFAVLFLLLSATNAAACVCEMERNYDGMCWEFKSGHAAIFVGSVTAVTKSDDRPYGQRVLFVVQESFRGITGKKVTIKDRADYGSPTFYRVGQTYLVYAFGTNGEYSTGCCTRVRVAADAGDEIAHLQRLATASQGAIIVGTVKVYAADRNFVSKLNKPVSGKVVSIEGPLGNQAVTTDEFVRYAVSGLVDGHYRVRLDLGDKYRPVVSPDITLEPNGCSELDFRTDPKPQ
jgi:hypothetical protein